MASNVALDHIIILVPYATLQSPPKWVTDHFTLTTGGRHADGKTENKLICLQDGSYIELIAFINDDPKHREGHWWGDKPYGIIDFAFTTPEPADVNFAIITEDLQDNEGGIKYNEPVEGARKQDYGEELKWKVTFPDVEKEYRRGELPFFCHDITDRKLRVPMEKENTVHPSGAYGIKKLTICVSQPHEMSSKVRSLVAAYAAFLDAPNANQDPDVGVFTVNRLHQVKGAEDIQLFVYALPDDTEKITDGENVWFDLVVGGFGERLMFRELMMTGGSGVQSTFHLDVDILAE